MTTPDQDEQVFPSTTWEWKRVKMRRPAGGQRHVGRRPSFFGLLPRWDGRRPLTMKVTYRGGPEAWYEVRTRGGVIRRPGYVALHDLMETVYGGQCRT